MKLKTTIEVPNGKLPGYRRYTIWTTLHIPADVTLDISGTALGRKFREVMCADRTSRTTRAGRPYSRLFATCWARQYNPKDTFHLVQQWHSKAAFLRYAQSATAKSLMDLLTDVALGSIEHSVGEHSNSIKSYNPTIGRSKDPPWAGFTEISTLYFKSTMSKDAKSRFEQDLQDIRLQLQLRGTAAGLRRGCAPYHLFWLPGFRSHKEQKCIAARLWLAWEPHKHIVADQAGSAVQSSILAGLGEKQLEELGLVHSETYHCEFGREDENARY